MESIIDFSHSLLKSNIQPGDHVVDATAGNGYDTALLAECVGAKGLVYSFDIQKSAIQASRERLKGLSLTDCVQLLQTGHEHIDQVLAEDEELAAAIFNLGYLPKGDKTIITQADTTIQAFRGILKRLKKEG